MEPDPDRRHPLAPGDSAFDEGLLFTTLTVIQNASAAETALFQRSPYLFRPKFQSLEALSPL